MKILRQVLNDLLHSVPCAPPETGGILGGKFGVISTYVVDYGQDMIDNYGHYSPDVKKLNRIVSNWAKRDIELYGIFHSHFPGGDQLSLGDKNYITKIMLAMPVDVNRLFFPIVLPTQIIGYQASRYGSQIPICRVDIKIL